MSCNLGATTLQRRKRACDPMRTYDALPPELRRWIAQAALPWSPRSCARLWKKARQRGLGAEAALATLERAQAGTLALERPVRGPRRT
ncbi:MAG: hypothetical protein JJ859_08380 [Roseicyclus sp.]|nr:hypothetical protein [Roseicyclus sp.]